MSYLLVVDVPLSDDIALNNAGLYFSFDFRGKFIVLVWATAEKYMLVQGSFLP